MTGRSRRRGGAGRRVAFAVLGLVLLSTVLLAGADDPTTFDTATLERQPAADVVADESGVVSLDVAADLHTGETERLVNTSNGLDRSVTVTVSVTGDATGYGHLVIDGNDVGDSETYTLSSGGSERIDFDTDCDSSLVGDDVTFSVDVDADGITGRASRAVTIESGSCGTTTGVVYAVPSSRDLRTVRDGGKTTYDVTNVQVVGPQSRDLDGDGRLEIPYVNGSDGSVYAVDRANETTQLLEAGTLGAANTAAEPATSRMAVGTWSGSDPSVFLVGDDESAIYRVDDSGNTKITDASNGASAVVGVLDVDGDGGQEIVFVDGSAQLRYVEGDGSIQKVQNGGVGSNNGVGAGGPADFDGDGTPRIPFVDGSGYLSVVTADGQKTTLSDGGTTITASKAPLAAFDWDGDGAPEIVYVDGGVLHLADDIDSGTANSSEITHDGTTVAAAEETGAA